MIDMMLWLATRPLTVACFVLLAGVRSVSLATSVWWHLVTGIAYFHVDLAWKALVWGIALVSLPIKFFTAMQRERDLVMNLRELQTQLENILWENKELEERFKRAVKERKMMETVFEEIEEEHERALSKIDQLENELQDLKEENLRLNEIQGKALWDLKSCDDKFGSVPEGIPHGSNYSLPSWSTNYKGSSLTLQDIRMQGDSRGNVEKTENQEQSPRKPSFTAYPYSPHKLSRELLTDEILERRRIVALSRSLFSSILSLVVSMIIWKAEDPCMPLVAALFIVVGMSLNSVVQFFSTIKNKPASDAVALLSVNWFILGTLTCPTLPSVARILAP